MESPHFFSGVVGVSADSFDPSKPSLDFSKLGKQRRRGKSDKRLQKAAASLFGVAPSKGALDTTQASSISLSQLRRACGSTTSLSLVVITRVRESVSVFLVVAA
eukprot:gb/GEZN01025844.1/.p2 GENE.gb/GEZN01025844.1/~~gb/GEZN01025844.1/.p2  ORF type:complete len:122 (-),score=6.71 gb/GEZN01025844.1/:171-482(-)